MNAFEEGQYAFCHGTPYLNNPYLRHEIGFVEWAEGWLAEEDKWLDR